MKRVLTLGGIALALLLLGYATGRYVAPTKVITQEKVQVIEKQTTVVQQKVDTSALLKAIQDLSRANNIVRTVVTEKKPDGTTVTHDTTEDHSTSTSHVDSSSTNQKNETTSIAGEKGKTTVEEHTKIVERPRKNWLVGLTGGYQLPFQLPGPLSLGRNLTPVAGVVLGLEGHRRLIGPIWSGIWVQTTGTVGFSLGVEF